MKAGDNDNRWYDINDKKDHAKCGGRKHSIWWLGPQDRQKSGPYEGPAWVNHFQMCVSLKWNVGVKNVPLHLARPLESYRSASEYSYLHP